MDEPVEIVKVVAGIIQREMSLQDEQVFLYNQNFPLPPVKGLFVSIGILHVRPFGASSIQRSDPVAGLVWNQTVNMQETYSISVYSQDSSARQRKHEIVFALTGVFAEQQMEKYAFKIGYIPTSFVDASYVEASSRINRYVLTVNVLCAYSRSRAVEYYDDFEKPPYSLLTNP